jgi:glutamate--cysteine ligase
MARDASDSRVIESRDQLIEALESGSKPPERWRIGTEHEKLIFNRADCSPVPYAGPRRQRTDEEKNESHQGKAAQTSEI